MSQHRDFFSRVVRQSEPDEVPTRTRRKAAATTNLQVKLVQSNLTGLINEAAVQKMHAQAKPMFGAAELWAIDTSAASGSFEEEASESLIQALMEFHVKGGLKLVVLVPNVFIRSAFEDAATKVGLPSVRFTHGHEGYREAIHKAFK